MTQFSTTLRRLQSRACASTAAPSAALAGLVAAGLLVGCQDRRDAAAADAASLAALVASCVDAMVRSSCRVMNGPTASSAASVVFVAGVGPVDADAYRRLRSSGEAMCGVIEQACRSDWNDPQCKTAQSLWPGVSAKTPAAAPGPR